MLKRRTWAYAPGNYDDKEAKAWAAGWNHAIEALGTSAPRKAEDGDLGFDTQGRLLWEWLAKEHRRAIGMHPALGAGYGAPPRNVSARIQNYLVSGGLFNPELANHQAVRDLLLDARDTIEALRIIANR